MLGSIRKFVADRTGAFAIQFAIMVVPLTVCTGLAVDGGRAFLARYELAQALDAAALAVGSTTTGTQDNLAALAQKYVDANFRTKHNGPIKITLGDNAAGVVVNLKGEVKLDTYFMPLIGKDTVLVTAESTIRRGGNNVEVALSIDITGSMDDPPAADPSGERKIVSLQAAARNLINTVIATSQPPASSYYSRMAIIPWSNNVFINDATLATNLRGAVTGTVSISGMTWRNGSERPVTATWRNGTSITSTSSVKVISISRQGSQYSSRTTRITFNGNPTTTINGSSVALADGDIIVLTGTTGGNSGWPGQLNTKKFKLSGRTVSGSNVYFTLQTPTSATNASNFQDGLGSGSTPAAATFANVHKCFEWQCLVYVSGSGFNPGPVADSNIYLSGFSGTAGTTNYAGLNSTSLSSPRKVAATPAPVVSGSTTTFVLTGTSYLNHVDAASGTGNAQMCFQSADVTGTSGTDESDRCAIQVTAPVAPALVNGSVIRLTGVSTSGTNWGANVNNLATASFNVGTTANTNNQSGTSFPSWLVEQVSGNSFVLTGSVAPNTTVPTSNLGNAQCLVDGCAIISFINRSGVRVWRNITNCVTERRTGDVSGDTAPGTGQFLGRFYEGDGNAACAPRDTIMGLDDDRADLIAKINSLDDNNDSTSNIAPHGTTAGQIGMGWASYMVSYKWRNVIPAAMSEFQPAIQNAANTSRVVVFMSDGQFNTAHCGGVQASDFNSGSESDDTHALGVCNANTAPFAQAQAVCSALRTAKIRVYTVGFDVPADSEAWTFMQECATEPSKAYLAATGTELQDAFDEIAEDIARLRISQ